MKTTAELQARKEALLESERRSTSFLNCCVPASEAIELIEEILRLRYKLAVANDFRGKSDKEALAFIINGPKPIAEPVKWITGKPYRNDDRP